MTKIAFFGLGEIGAPMASRLAASGASMLVHNRSPEKQAQWLASNEGVALTGAADVRDVDCVISCVGNDEDLRALYFGDDGLISNLNPGTLVIDHTTASAVVAQELHREIAGKGSKFLDAPISGGSAGARNGTLSVMVGGDKGAVTEATPVFDQYAGVVSHIGGPGAGQLCKMVNQLCIAGVLQGLGEGLALARAANLDVERVIGAISGGAAASWQMENRSSFMLGDTYEAGFAARLMSKDLGLCLEEADRLNLDLRGAKLVADEYSDLIARGLGDEDFSNLHRLLRGD
ncbi:MAG: NAD(P)-dependent oxidoreductase [Solirubrobacterales bacterium]